MESPRFLDAGDGALVVEFGQSIDSQAHDRVLALDEALAAGPVPGILETVPTFRSLMILYDPLLLERRKLVGLAAELAQRPPEAKSSRDAWVVPCCYAPEFAEDLPHLVGQLGLSAERIVALHSQAEYRLYMYGFAPGFCYLGGLPEELFISRRAEPRPPTPENVVILAAGMSAIMPASMPTGWWLIGRTPERMFSVTRQPHVFAAVGDRIRFAPVSMEEFRSLEARARSGEIISRREG